MSLKYPHEPKISCFAFHQAKNGCTALRELVCACEGKCSFYEHKDNVDINEIERSIRNYSGPVTK